MKGLLKNVAIILDTMKNHENILSKGVIRLDLCFKQVTGNAVESRL